MGYKIVSETRVIGKGTGLTQSYPWGLYTGGKALCYDGKVRSLARIAQTADTFFSVPAAVKVNGKTVSGYVTHDEVDGEPCVLFIAYLYGKNCGELPLKPTWGQS